MGEKAVAFLFRFENLPADASWPAWGMNPWGSPEHPGLMGSNWEGCRVSVDDHYGKSIPNCKVLVVSRSTADQTANVRAGIAMGKWETVLTQKADTAGAEFHARGRTMDRDISKNDRRIASRFNTGEAHA